MTGRRSHDRRRTERAKQEERAIPRLPFPSNPAALHPTLYWTEHGLEVKEALMQRYEPFLSGGGVNTPRVNVCLLMMLDVISVRFTSNYVSKQSGESFKSSNVVIAKSSKSQSGRDFWQNSSHGIQIQIGNQSYQITKVIYKVTHSHSLSALNIFGKGIAATLDFMQEHMFYFVFHLVMTMHMVF